MNLKSFVDLLMSAITNEDFTIVVGDRVKLKSPIHIRGLVDPNKKILFRVSADEQELTTVWTGLSLKPAIVVATDQSFEFKCGGFDCDRDHFANTLIYYPHLDRKFYVSNVMLEPYEPE